MSQTEMKERKVLPLGEEQKLLKPEREFFSPENRRELQEKKISEKKKTFDMKEAQGVKAQIENQRRAHTLLTSMEWEIFPVYTFQKARRRFMVN